MTGETLRILDANMNRAREALRVVEDYARFALDDAELCQRLKDLRHALAFATRLHSPEAILARDTPGDVGKQISTPSERHRGGLADVVIAAGKRLGEAIRAIEELLKLEDVDGALAVERMRYALYEIERRIALTLRPRRAFARVRLYVIITEAACRADWLSTAEQAISGGADVVQLREPELADNELLARARRLRELCRAARTLLVVNDRPDVAMLCGADGVHVGQRDLPAESVRRVIGARMLLGVSTHNLEQVKLARLAGADYVGVGPVFVSETKPRPEMASALPGLEFARSAARLDILPTVAVAGITVQNAARVWETGVSAIAVASAVTMSQSPAQAARLLREGQATSP